MTNADVLSIYNLMRFRFQKKKNIHLLWCCRDAGMVAMFEKQVCVVCSCLLFVRVYSEPITPTHQTTYWIFIGIDRANRLTDENSSVSVRLKSKSASKAITREARVFSGF